MFFRFFFREGNVTLKRILYFTFSILLILFGLISAYQMRWISDDAFISLRYAKNLADGKGMVFNVGERVEGYTNFLWTLLLTPAHFSETVDPISISYFLGILSFLGVCIYLLQWNRKDSTSSFRFPFALSCFVFLHHNRVFATGGLETSLHGLLLLASAYHLTSQGRVTFYNRTLGILFSSLSCLNRPDGLLFHGLAGIYICLTFYKEHPDFSLKSLFRQKKFPFLLLLYVAPVFFYIWKLEYYGNLLPNTFYAKSGGSSYLAQGFLYFYLFLKMYYALIPVLGFSVFLFYRKLRECLRQKEGSKDFDWILLFVFPFFYAGYYTWIGGDFMFARFYLPILPLLFVWVESGLFPEVSKSSFWNRFRKIAVYSIPILILLRWDIYKGSPLPILHDVADENQIYKRETTEKLKTRLTPWRKHFESSQARVAFAGSECIFIYYLNPILAIETEAGLTDPTIARLTSQTRGRIGHEKTAPIDYLKKRKIQILFFTDPENQTNEYDALQIKELGVTWKILSYSPETMEELKKIPFFSFVDFGEYLDLYRNQYRSLPPTLRKEKFREFEDYYFANSKDKNRQDWYRKNL